MIKLQINIGEYIVPKRYLFAAGVGAVALATIVVVSAFHFNYVVWLGITAGATWLGWLYTGLLSHLSYNDAKRKGYKVPK